MRLDRYLSESGLGSRSQVRKWIRAGRVGVAGAAVRDPATPLPDRDLPPVTLDGAPVVLRRCLHAMLHKPAGVVTAMRDARLPTIAQLLPAEIRGRVAPVGRLDRDVTGLLLLTGDGVLAHRLASPKWEVDKTYDLHHDGPRLTAADVRRFAEGITLDDGTRCRPATLTPLADDHARLVIREGRYHQVKRMIRATGRNVLALTRTRVGPLALDPALEPGAFRLLTEPETAALYAAVSLPYEE